MVIKMMKKGFIDYYLDEWHANNYPQMIKELSGGRYEVSFAYGKIDSPLGGMTNRERAEKNGVELLGSIEEVIEKSDRLIVLSPDNPEMHEELCELPLKSGKLVYVDIFMCCSAQQYAVFKCFGGEYSF